MFIDDLMHRDKFAEFRNPLTAKVGYHFGDIYGCAPCRFKWFDSVSDLTDHILNVDLRLCSYDKDMHDEFRAGLSKALARVEIEGLTEKVREALNSIDWGFTMHWWGSLQDLLSGHTQFSRETLGSFAIEKRGEDGVMPSDTPAFLTFLCNCCIHDPAPHGDHDDGSPQGNSADERLPAGTPRH